MTSKAKFTEKRFVLVLIFVTSLFMLWGIALSISDVLIKHFQTVLKLTKQQSALVPLSVFGAYFIMSVPAGIFLNKFGYKLGVLLGLALFAGGCFLFVPAANHISFSLFRVALFVMGCGMATLETVAHPFAAALGDQRSSDRRVNFAQSFNAVGTIIGPRLGSYFLLSAAIIPGMNELDSVKNLYVYIGMFIILVAIAFTFLKIPALSTDANELHATDESVNIDSEPTKKLSEHKHFIWAVIAQFFNVAAQAGTWAYFINYGVEKMHLTAATAAKNMSIFMACMAAGRFAGTYLMKFVAPNKLLAVFAFINILMCLFVAQAWGWFSYVALFAINFFFSIMYPTIFSLGLKNLGQHTQKASSYISMGVVGGAIFPFIMGYIANKDIAQAYYLPIVCYVVIVLFATKFYKAK